MNRRTSEAVEMFKKEADTLQRSADAMYSSTNPEIVIARGPMLTRAAHLRHLAEVAEKAEALIANFNSERGHDGNDWLALDAFVNAEEVERG